MKAILVEDELLIAKVLANNLVSLGYEVAGIATNGLDAIDLVRNESPDLVFMDIFLDGELDGIETYKRIKEISPTKVIYITANNDPFYKQKARDVGYTAFLTKPIEKVTLQKVLSLA
ncbi:MAG: response regulator [Leptospira sp.]|nr:response regulator [Leptospira sp.]